MTVFQDMITFYVEKVADFLLTPPINYITVLIIGLFILKLIKYIMKG